MGKLLVLDHPVIQHKLTQMRDKSTGTQQFHQLVREVAMLMAYEVTRNLPLEDLPIETPVAPTIGKCLSGKKLAVVPILRAGLGLVDGFMAIMPTARIGHVGLYRNEETLEPVEYFCKLPADLDQRSVVVLDPMLATGGSASAALTLLKAKGAKKLQLAVLVAAPPGIERVRKDHPDVEIVACAVDQGLNEKGYIVPGLGDAGDRLFGTK